MVHKIENEDIVQYLKNEKFIEWKLFPTDELDHFWDEFQQKYPEERSKIEQAEKLFHDIKYSSYKISQEKKKEATNRLEHSLQVYIHKKKIRRLLVGTAAACIFGTILLIHYFLGESSGQNIESEFSQNYIIGNELESEDILFVTGNNTSAFQENIDIRVSKDKKAEIKINSDINTEIAIQEKSMNQLIVPYGKRSKITLPDGTLVWLNSGSILEFPSEFKKDSREINLTGEGYLEVSHDPKRPFYVHTAKFNLKVYGTKFNINAYADNLSSVVLVEGKVGLQTTGKKEYILVPEEQATYSENDTFKTQKIDVESFISWKDGYLTFNDTPMSEVLKQIGRYYNLSFDYENDSNLQGQTCTGKIILSDNLENVLTALALISSTSYKIEKNKIYIYKN